MHIYFIGIGGIGVSSIAQYYLSHGHQVSGSDLVRTEIIDLLTKKGAEIVIGQNKAENLPHDLDSVIYSPAVQKDNPELAAAISRNIKCQSYPQALGALTKQYFTIAISGTHGKSTTTAMIALILIKAGLDPTVIIGTKLKEFGNSNFKAGESKYLVIEADEWNASFLNYSPNIIVLNNVELEHLDYYKDLNHILRTYQEYVGGLKDGGYVVANQEDENIKRILAGCSFESKADSIKWFSLAMKEAKEIKVALQVPGEHNVKNGLAALQVARILDIADKTTFEAISEFHGTWRRFEEDKVVINDQPITIISDYGHHPTEVKATLLAAKEKYSHKKIWVIFQPHQYQRTYYLFDDFVKVFQENELDKLILTDIYDVAGRENIEIKAKVSSKKLAAVIDKSWVAYLPQAKLASYIKSNIKDIDVLLIMGAGNIYKLSQEFNS